MAVLLGRQTAGTTPDFESSAWTIAWDFVAVASGTLATIFAQTKVANSGFSSGSLGIYSHDAGNNRPNALLASATAGAGFNGTGVFSGDVSGAAVGITAGTTYWLAFTA